MGGGNGGGTWRLPDSPIRKITEFTNPEGLWISQSRMQKNKCGFSIP